MASSLAEDVNNYTKDLEFPASKADIIDAAQDEGADDMLLDAMRDQLPDSIFDSPRDIRSALGDGYSY